MGLENKNQEVQTETTFSVPKELVYPNLKTDASIAKRINEDTTESIGGIALSAIKKIESNLKLTFLSEKDAESLVCMANSSEVRDDFRDIFDFNDLRNYIYAVLHTPDAIDKYKDLSKIEVFEVPYPKDASLFWKLENLGSRLRYLNPTNTASDENQKIKVSGILKEIATITQNGF